METLLFPQKSHRKVIRVPDNSEYLAELLGVVFGDGGINNEWQLVISLNSEKDAEYANHIVNLIKQLFDINVAVRKRPNQNTLVLVVSSMNLVDFLVGKGAVRGNKIKQEIDIPTWIAKNKKFERAFVRGLVDTDGCLYIHKHKVSGKEYKNLGFCFTNYSAKLVESIAKILQKNDIKPYVTNSNRNICLYSYKMIERYLQLFESRNPRILEKYEEWRDAGVV